MVSRIGRRDKRKAHKAKVRSRKENPLPVIEGNFLKRSGKINSEESDKFEDNVILYGAQRIQPPLIINRCSIELHLLTFASGIEALFEPEMGFA